MKKTVFLIALACMGCQKEQKPSGQLQKATWFEGNWVMPTAQGDLFENWKKVNDSVMAGESYFIKEKDTLFSETVELTEVKGVVTYNVTAKGQNDDKPVAFKMTSSTAQQLVFENPKHDFPNKIIYKKITADSIVASISGTNEGKPASETYPMGRAK